MKHSLGLGLVSFDIVGALFSILASVKTSSCSIDNCERDRADRSRELLPRSSKALFNCYENILPPSEVRVNGLNYTGSLNSGRHLINRHFRLTNFVRTHVPLTCGHNNSLGLGKFLSKAGCPFCKFGKCQTTVMFY